MSRTFFKMKFGYKKEIYGVYIIIKAAIWAILLVSMDLPGEAKEEASI